MINSKRYKRNFKQDIHIFETQLLHPLEEYCVENSVTDRKYLYGESQHMPNFETRPANLRSNGYLHSPYENQPSKWK